jgi:hypothetical protein
MELGLNDKLHHMEEVINKLFMALLSTKDSSSNTNARSGPSRHNREEFMESAKGGRQMFSSKLTKLEFPRYSGDDPTEWFNRVKQFFKYQGTIYSSTKSILGIIPPCR